MATTWRSATRCAGSRTSWRKGRIWFGRRPLFSLSALVAASAVGSQWSSLAIRSTRISEGARVGPGSTEAAPHPLEQRVRLVERSLRREARQVECLRVPSVRGEERLDLGPRLRVAELALHDRQDFTEAVARELDER